MKTSLFIQQILSLLNSVPKNVSKCDEIFILSIRLMLKNV